MRFCALIFAAACLIPTADAKESPRARLAAAEERIEKVITRLREAKKKEKPLPVKELTAAMEALTALETRAALARAAKYLYHRDVDVACRAVAGLVATKGDWRLLAGSHLAKRADYRHYRPERHEVYVAVVRGIARTGYLGGHEVLAKALGKSRVAEVILEISRALVDLGDKRAIPTLFDFADWNRGKNESFSRAKIRKHSDNQSVRSKPEVRNSGNGKDRQTNRHTTAGTEPAAPAEKEVIGKVYRMLFELMGREFKTWEALVEHMQKNRKEIEKLGLDSAAGEKKQTKKIAGLGS